jgi:hypothetical protein
MFFRKSRYADTGDHHIIDDKGKKIRYKKIRFIPKTRAQMVHIIGQKERLDLLAFRYYKDPERFWRICDANLVMWPQDLVSETGKRILVPPSEG